MEERVLEPPFEEGPLDFLVGAISGTGGGGGGRGNGERGRKGAGEEKLSGGRKWA